MAKLKDLLLGGLGGVAAPVAANLDKLGISLNPNKAILDELEIEEKKRRLGISTDASGKPTGMKKGGAVKSSASKRADGCAVRGKTRGKIV